MIKHTIKSDYLNSIYQVQDYKKLVTKAAAQIKAFKAKNPFDAIAFTGTSGAALAYPISAMLKIPLICIRKGHNHYGQTIEGCVTATRYIIIDDFISMGRTMKKITSSIKKEMPTAKPVAIFLYTAIALTGEWNGIPIKIIGNYKYT